MEATTKHVIERFTPKLLSKQEWAFARPAAIAAVDLAEPHCAADAKALLCALVAFLRTPCGWDRVSAPDLDALLTDATISNFARTRGGNTHTRAVYATNLRALLRARAGLTRAPRKPVAPEGAPSVLQDVAAVEGVSATALVRGHEATTGRAVSSYQLQRLRPANVTGATGCTVHLSTATTSALLGAEILEPVKEAVSTNTSATSTTKPLSGRKRLAQERADRASAARALAGPRLSPHPDMAALEPHVRAAIEAYRPQRLPSHVWPALRPLTIRLVAGFRPVSVTSARNAATVVVRFLLWVQCRPERPAPAQSPTAKELLGSTLLDQYLKEGGSGVHQNGKPASSVATARSILRRAVNSLDADYVPVKIPSTGLAAPYDVRECERLVEIALAQPTKVKTRNACFLLGLTLGAGLAPADLRHVRYRDIREVTNPRLGKYLVVDVQAGAVRTVVVRRQYEPLLRRALSLREGARLDAPVLGTNMTRRNVTQAARRSIVTAVRGGVDIDPFRLRTTWLFAALNAPVPFTVVLEQAGLKSARSLGSLLDLCPRPDATEVARAVLGLTACAVGAGR